MQVHMKHKDYDDWALGPLSGGLPGSVLDVVYALCCAAPLTKCGNRAARRGPKHALEAVFGSKRLKARAETSCVTAAGRFLPRAVLVGTTCAAKVGLEKWREHLCHAIPHGHSQDVEAWQPRQFVHQMDLATLKQSNCESDDRG